VVGLDTIKLNAEIRLRKFPAQPLIFQKSHVSLLARVILDLQVNL
jgi:hypothetical protein